ncbi:MAG: hypothetical protein R2735_05395 [Microthrixaceae bacterium]
MTILSITALALAVGIFAAVAITRTRTVLEARTTEELKIIAREWSAPHVNRSHATMTDDDFLARWRSFQAIPVI